MADALQEIINIILQVALVPGIIANFVFAMPAWITGALVLSFVFGLVLLILRIVGV